MKLHLIRRDVKLSVKIGCYIASILLSFVLGGIFLLALGINPLAYYRDMITIGLIGNYYPAKSVEGLLKLFVPLLITSLALSLSFKMRFWNIGGEGQVLIGGLAAAASMIYLQDKMSNGFVILAMIFADEFLL